MATTESYGAGLMPATNDLAALLAICGAYITRFGVVAEGVAAWWHLPLVVTTDLLLPVLAGVWLLVVPVYQVWESRRE
jgi:hypothetical protein